MAHLAKGMIAHQRVRNVSAACPVSGGRTLCATCPCSQVIDLHGDWQLAHDVHRRHVMKIAELKRLSNSDSPGTSVRGTEKQDTAITAPQRPWHKQRWVYV